MATYFVNGKEVPEYRAENPEHPDMRPLTGDGTVRHYFTPLVSNGKVTQVPNNEKWSDKHGEWIKID